MQVEYFGIGSINELKEILSKENAKKVFIVRGRSSYENSGLKKKVEQAIEGFEYCYFSDFAINPKLEDVKKGIELFKKENCDIIIAAGGGSAIDIAKSINILAAQDKDPKDIILKKEEIERRGKTFIAIPSTSGTGSEATHFAVVYVDGIKYSLAHKSLLPDYSIIDPTFTFSLPKKITAATGMDAFCQAIESYWAVKSTEESKAYAREAITLIIKNIEKAVNAPDEESRVALAKGANLAGKAINISKTTACHAISYPITSHFRVPHGHAVALTLGEMLVFNMQVREEDCLDPKGVEYVKKTISEIIKLLGAESPEEAKKRLTVLMTNIELETSLSRLNIDDKNIIIEEGFNPDRVKNNPRKVEKEDLMGILNHII